MVWGPLIIGYFFFDS